MDSFAYRRTTQTTSTTAHEMLEKINGLSFDRAKIKAHNEARWADIQKYWCLFGFAKGTVLRCDDRGEWTAHHAGEYK